LTFHQQIRALQAYAQGQPHRPIRVIPARDSDECEKPYPPRRKRLLPHSSTSPLPSRLRVRAVPQCFHSSIRRSRTFSEAAIRVRFSHPRTRLRPPPRLHTQAWLVPVEDANRLCTTLGIHLTTQKISGTFRGTPGGNTFCRTMGIELCR